jgi:hypothetical protein
MQIFFQQLEKYTPCRTKKAGHVPVKKKRKRTESPITEAVNCDAELWVNLDEPVPVLVSYFTALIDKDGLLNFRDDIYGHGKALAAKLFDWRLQWYCDQNNIY